MIYLTKILSIDIRDQLVSIAYLGRSFTGIDLIASTVIPKKPVASSSIKEDEENNYDEDLIWEIQSFVDEKKISPEETVMCFPRNTIMFKFIDLPSPDEASLPNILEFELERLIPMNPADIYYDYKIMGQAGERIFKVLLAAVPKKIADYYAGLLKRVGMSPTVLNISTFGSFNVGYFSDIDLTSPTGIIDVSAGDFEIILMENNSIRFTRSIKINSENWGKCFFEGREFLKDDGKTVEKLADNIIENLDRSASVANEKDGGNPVEKILLSGGGQSDEILLNYLTKKTNLRIDPLILSEKTVKTKNDMDGTNSLITAIGLGLGELKKTPLKINLLPTALRAKRKKSQVVWTTSLLGLILFFVFAMIGSAILKDRLILSNVNDDLKKIKKKISTVEEMELKYSDIQYRISELNKLWENKIIILDVIKELTQTFPDNTWLSTLNIKGKNVELSGRSTVASSLISILDKSPMLKDVRFNGSVESKDGIEKFKIKMVIDK